MADSKAKENTVKPTDIAEVRGFIAKVRNRRLEWERNAFVNMMFKDGRHYVNDQGVIDIRDPALLRRTVNKYRSTLRKMENSILFNDPIVDVLPERGEEDQTTTDELDAASFVVLSEYKKNNYKQKLKTLIDNAALKTWCVASILPCNYEDDSDEDDDRLTDFQVYDPMDTYFDNKDFEKAQIIIVSSSEDKQYLKAQGYKNIDKVVASTSVSHSFLKNQYDQYLRMYPSADNVIIDQVFKMEYDKNEKNEIDPTSARVVTFTLAGNEVVKEKTVMDGYDDLSDIFKICYLEYNEHLTYQSPWMSDVVPLQRSLNDSSENIDTILNSTAKVRVMQRRGDSNTVQMMEDRHLQKIAYEGDPPVFGEFQNPPDALFNVVSMRTKQIEDMVGQHGPSLGEKSSDVSSGRQQALIQAADMDNLTEPSDNLELFLEDVFREVLDIASKNITKIQRVYGSSKDDFKTVIAEGSYDATDEKHKNATQIKPFTHITVKVVPGNKFSIEQAKSDYLQLLPIMAQFGMQAEGKAIYNVLVRKMSVGAERDIARLVEQETEKENAANSDAIIAKEEVKKLWQGQPVTATPEQDHKLHIAMKMQGLKTFMDQHGEAGKKSPIFDGFMKNVMQHRGLMEAPPLQSQGPQQVTPPAPQPAQ